MTAPVLYNICLIYLVLKVGNGVLDDWKVEKSSVMLRVKVWMDPRNQEVQIILNSLTTVIRNLRSTFFFPERLLVF